METWAVEASAHGYRFGVGDLLIAAIAKDNGGSIWSLDADFLRMQKRGWISVYQ